MRKNRKKFSKLPGYVRRAKGEMKTELSFCIDKLLILCNNIAYKKSFFQRYDKTLKVLKLTLYKE